MNLRTKYLLVVLPFIVAGLVGYMYLMPLFDEYNTKSATIEEKKTEAEGLQAKLSGQSKVNQKKIDLEKEISALRSAVPKSPELDLLNIDLEKMCEKASVDFVAFSPPGDADKPTISKTVDTGAQPKTGKGALQDRVNKVVGGATGGAAAPAKGTAAGEEDAGETPDSGLEKVTMKVVVTGDYYGVMKFMHELENYERVVNIVNLTSRIPLKAQKKKSLPDEAEPSESAELGDPKQLYVSMLVDAYYLP